MKLISIFLLTLSLSALAQINPENALKYVPGGTIIETDKDEIKVKTANGSIVDLDFKRNGSLEEASGDQIESDAFVPGEDWLPLEKIASLLKEQGYQLKGDWNYEKSFFKGWQYEVEVIHNNQHLDVWLDAKSGKITKTKVDD